MTSEIHPTPIGNLYDKGPYRAWRIAKWSDGYLWAISGAGGWNCWGNDGRVLLYSKEDAEYVIRSHGHEPAEERLE